MGKVWEGGTYSTAFQWRYALSPRSKMSLYWAEKDRGYPEQVLIAAMALLLDKLEKVELTRMVEAGEIG